jgi:NAD(P)-dependent dehydrogenase (short-subunit alcohol dehydrogenase family)
MLRKAERADIVGVTSSVGQEPRAFWGAYGSSKAALESLLGAYADETEHTKRIRVHIVNPGPTRTRMRELAYPGEEPESVKPPEKVAEFILARLLSDAKSGELVRADD